MFVLTLPSLVAPAAALQSCICHDLGFNGLDAKDVLSRSALRGTLCLASKRCPPGFPLKDQSFREGSRHRCEE